MEKSIKIITSEKAFNTKIYIDGRDIFKEIDGIFGVDINLRIDSLPKITIHRYASKLDYKGNADKIDIVIHKPKWGRRQMYER